jgi:ethanolamine ammonia-lyase large subunit
MNYKIMLGTRTYQFKSLKDLLAQASPLRSADVLALVAAPNHHTRVAAQICLSDLPLKVFLNEELIPAKIDEVSALIEKQFSPAAFSEISHLTVGGFREFLLHEKCDNTVMERIQWGLTPEMVAAVCKIMRNQDLISVSKKRQVISRFRNTIGLPGHFSVRLQPNHPTDDINAVLASTLDGLLMGSGDAVIGINPALDSPPKIAGLLKTLDDVRLKLEIPTQICVLTHVTTQIELMKQKIPMDLVFQSIGGTELTNISFGINLSMLREAFDLAQDLKRGTLGQNLMYFETGQGSALSAQAHHNCDAQTIETRAYAVAREFSPLLVNSVVGFIGPEYLYDGKQIIRAGLEDHFCGKLMGLPMGIDICYTNHADADQNDMDILLTLLGISGCNFIMGVPGADDIMLNYQSTSFHDALYIRQLLNLKPAPEFHQWLRDKNVMTENLMINKNQTQHLLSLPPFSHFLEGVNP